MLSRSPTNQPRAPFSAARPWPLPDPRDQAAWVLSGCHRTVNHRPHGQSPSAQNPLENVVGNTRRSPQRRASWARAPSTGGAPRSQAPTPPCLRPARLSSPPGLLGSASPEGLPRVHGALPRVSELFSTPFSFRQVTQSRGSRVRSHEKAEPEAFLPPLRPICPSLRPWKSRHFPASRVNRF